MSKFELFAQRDGEVEAAGEKADWESPNYLDEMEKRASKGQQWIHQNKYVSAEALGEMQQAVLNKENQD